MKQRCYTWRASWFSWVGRGLKASRSRQQRKHCRTQLAPAKKIKKSTALLLFLFQASADSETFHLRDVFQSVIYIKLPKRTWKRDLILRHKKNKENFVQICIQLQHWSDTLLLCWASAVGEVAGSGRWSTRVDGLVVIYPMFGKFALYDSSAVV